MKLKNYKAGGIIRRLLFFSMLLAAPAKGYKQRLQPRIVFPLLQGGPHAGSWESNDVSLEYQYVAQEGSFKLNIGGNAKRKYDQLSRLD